MLDLLENHIPNVFKIMEMPDQGTGSDDDDDDDDDTTTTEGG